MKAPFAYSSAVLLAMGISVTAGNWPAWRGPDMTGVSSESEKGLPLQWSDKENLRWRVELPDRGNSSPIVWGSRVFVTQAIQKENRRTLMCLDRSSGKLIWQSGVTYAESEPTQESNPAHPLPTASASLCALVPRASMPTTSRARKRGIVISAN